MTPRKRTLVTPFWVRLATETSFSAGWLLIAFPAVLYPLYLALEALFGRGFAAGTDFAGVFEVRFPLVIITMLGYIAMMYTYAARGTFRDLEALRSVLPGSEATYAELRKKLTRFERRRLWIGGLIGFAFGCVLWEIAAGPWAERIRAGEWSLRSVCNFLLVSAFWITGGRGTMYLIDSARLYSRIGERYVAIDLLDPGPLSPLTRHGLRIVLLLTIITAATVIVNVVGSAPVPSPAVAVVFLSCLWNVPLAAAAFVLPGLLAYKHEIESVREWPFDAPTLARFFLYVAIPLGSWIGGALVERLLGAALD
jgi:hypothetical protein